MPTVDLDLTSTLKLFGDPTRLRILALLADEELTVGDVAKALDLSQSRVSNHLRHLREARLLTERHRGTACHLRLDRTAKATGGLAHRLWAHIDAELGHLPERDADRARLARVLAERRGGEASFFDRLASEWDNRAGDFTSGLGRTRALLQAVRPTGVYADIGCGTGYMARPLLGAVERLVLVDASAGMLEEAERRLAPEARGTVLDFRLGSSTDLPVEDEELDGIVAGLLLHHMDEPAAALAEMHRCLVPGGRAVVLELAPHNQDWMHEALGDRHLGLEPRDVMADMERAGFTDVHLDAVDDRYLPSLETPTEGPGGGAPDLSLFVVRGSRPTS